ATPSGLDLLNSAATVARLEAEIDRQLDDYARRPRKKFIGARTKEYRFAQYVEDWRHKIERVGTLNYPEAARGRLYGSLLLVVAIRADGSIERVEVQRSSGEPILDEAAKRIVQLAAPFAPFPSDIRGDTDILEIARTWTFTNADKVIAQ
ncbi:energy transducer TonB, partial [Aromatoleum bremense]